MDEWWHLIEDNPLDVADEIGAPVEHGAKNLRGHDEARRFRIDGHVPCDQAHIPEASLPVESIDGQKASRETKVGIYIIIPNHTTPIVAMGPGPQLFSTEK